MHERVFVCLTHAEACFSVARVTMVALVKWIVFSSSAWNRSFNTFAIDGCTTRHRWKKIDRWKAGAEIFFCFWTKGIRGSKPCCHHRYWSLTKGKLHIKRENTHPSELQAHQCCLRRQTCSQVTIMCCSAAAGRLRGVLVGARCWRMCSECMLKWKCGISLSILSIHKQNGLDKAQRVLQRKALSIGRSGWCISNQVKVKGYKPII